MKGRVITMKLDARPIQQAVDDLIEQCEAITPKIRLLPFDHVWGPLLSDHPGHVEACLQAGGFPAYSDVRERFGQLVPCLPFLYPEYAR